MTPLSRRGPDHSTFILRLPNAPVRRSRGRIRPSRKTRGGPQMPLFRRASSRRTSGFEAAAPAIASDEHPGHALAPGSICPGVILIGPSNFLGNQSLTGTPMKAILSPLITRSFRTVFLIISALIGISPSERTESKSCSCRRRSTASSHSREYRMMSTQKREKPYFLFLKT